MGRSEHLDFEIVKKRARELRSKATPSETLLWKELRNRKLFGYKFLRQHPIVYNPYGPIHEINSEYDQFRDAEMVNLGLHILRIKNEELLDIKEVLKKIETYLNSIN